MIEKRINYYRGGGADMGTVSASSSSPSRSSSSPRGGGADMGTVTAATSGRDRNNIVMENIGGPGVEDVMGPNLNFAEFSPVTYSGAPNIFSPYDFNQPKYQDRILELMERQRREDLRNIVEASDQYADPYESFRSQQMGSLNTPFMTVNAIADFLKKPLQIGMTTNRNFFLDKVLPSGKFTTEDFASLPRSQQEALYSQYMQGRLSGATDAYGNPLPQQDNNPLRDLLAQQTPQEPLENLQGGIAQLYNQYLENLGSL